MRSTESDSLWVGGRTIRPLSPIEPAEELRREEILAGDRGGLQLQRQPGSGWRNLTRGELAAVVVLPALIMLGIVLGASSVPPAVIAVSVGLTIFGLAAIILRVRRPRA